MTAKEMFKELGFTQKSEENGIIEYQRKNEDIYELTDDHIIFDTIDKNITLQDNGEYMFGQEMILSVEELHAINAQCKELGWL